MRALRGKTFSAKIMAVRSAIAVMFMFATSLKIPQLGH